MRNILFIVLFSFFLAGCSFGKDSDNTSPSPYPSTLLGVSAEIGKAEDIAK